MSSTADEPTILKHEESISMRNIARHQVKIRLAEIRTANILEGIDFKITQKFIYQI